MFKRHIMKKVLLTLSFIMALILGANQTFAQGVTTSALSGKIEDDKGEALVGATVVAVHIPSGTQYGVATNVNGRFRLSNMRVGGPYKITVSYIGFKNNERSGIVLALGQTLNLTIKMLSDAATLKAVEVVGRKDDVFDGNRTGIQTIVNEQRINETPTVSRSIADFARLEPTANLSEGDDGFSVSVAGQNNRYNAIYIDGAVNNDVFGLSGSGTNGGQTGVAPISIDAIEQFQVSVAPFDVRQSGFAGGSINAVTRSGSNKFEGSVYGFFRNQDMAGITPIEKGDIATQRAGLPDFSAMTYGVRLGGPIIKDKLFFFLSAELQRDETPLPFNASTYQGNSSITDLNQLVSKLNGYGYDPGGYIQNNSFLNAERFLARVDYNINKNHRLTFRISNTGARNQERFQSGTQNINFQNGAESFTSNTTSAALELRSSFGNSYANKFTAGYTRVKDDRDPTGNPFPRVEISDGQGTITFGSEPFSTANLLTQDVFTITNDFEIYKGKHTITIGTHNEFYSIGNLFIAFNYGSYEFSSLNDFLTDQPSTDYSRNYSQVDNIVGDNSQAIAKFNAGQIGFYVQDEYQANDRLKLTAGIRVDIPIFQNTPTNEAFNNTTVPLLSQNYDLKGARTGSFIKPQVMISPRFGFNYDVNGDQTLQLRGGVGVFTSRVPLVWPGGAFNNYGLNVGGVFNGTDVFNPDVNSQSPGAIDPGNVTPSGSIDLFAEDFKIPQVLKADIAVDYKLPWGMIGTLEFLYTKVLSAPTYQNVNLKPSTSNLTGADNRPVYDRRDEIDDTYGRILLASSTDKGYAYNIVAQIQKPFDNGLSFAVSYSYGDSYSVFDGTSSQNSSQWRGLHTVNGRNNMNEIQRSAFSAGSRVLAQVSYRKEYAGFGASQIGLVFTGQSGRPYSYIYNDNGNLTNEDSRERSLIYVPRNASEINLVDITDDNNNVTKTAAQQWTELDSFIESDKYLSTRRGQYAERNMNRAPFLSFIDLRFLQEFYVKTAKGHKNILQFTLDIFNWGNMLNSEWGQLRTVSSEFQLINYEGRAADGTTPQFTYNGVQKNDPAYANFDDSGFRSSRWQMQVGVRYIFK
ncbi:Oar protein, putative [Microscilla marina ATCC 23134]|uniref:Oar protein, putative n=2 Tax=Microscilla marina TaxID=1027 RepID=A1ZRV6_MICM2|nr:Oar protein, putative [Microscilla marina ATCC 23134]